KIEIDPEPKKPDPQPVAFTHGKILYTPTGWVTNVAVSPDGKWAVFVASNETTIWNLGAGALHRRLRLELARAVAFSPDSRLLAVGTGGMGLTKDKSAQPAACGAQLFDVDSGTVVYTFEHADQPAAAIAFSPDGKYVAVGGNPTPAVGVEAGVRLWDVKTGAKVRELKGASGGVLDLAFSADGARLFAATNLKPGGPMPVESWEVESG